MKARHRLTEAAENDIVDILAWSQAEFGDAARQRYERLIVTALLDIAADPALLGSLARPELGADVRSWHLRGSRGSGVRRPRHFLIYRRIDVALIAIGRVLHERWNWTGACKTPDCGIEHLEPNLVIGCAPTIGTGTSHA